MSFKRGVLPPSSDVAGSPSFALRRALEVSGTCRKKNSRCLFHFWFPFSTVASEPLALVLFGTSEHRLRGIVVVENFLLRGLR